ELQVMPDRHQFLAVAVASRSVPHGEGNGQFVARCQRNAAVPVHRQRPAQHHGPAAVLPAPAGTDLLRDARPHGRTAESPRLDTAAREAPGRVSGIEVAHRPWGEEILLLAKGVDVEDGSGLT